MAGRGGVRVFERLFGLVLTFGVFGCAVGPDYEPPELTLPDAWHQELAKGLDDGSADLHAWWTFLGDETLSGLIARAAAGNLDLKTALARIEESRALIGLARGEHYPGLDATGAALRTRTSEDISPDLPFPTGFERNDNFFRTGIESTWEIDVFGRIRRLVESAEASHEASIEARRDLVVLLFAEVALNYIEVRSLQERIRLARENVELQRATLELTEQRLQAQIRPELDVRQAESNLANTEAAIPGLQVLLQQAIHRLGVLVGDYPSALAAELSQAASIPPPPESVALGLPAELLRQRPDIRRAERALAAQTARIGVATADLYPRFTLNGTLALEASQLQPLFNASSHAYSFGPAVRWNLFSGGRIRSNIRAEDARAQQALHSYEQTVLLALEDVENAVVGYVQEIERRDALERSVTAAVRSVELVDSLYRTGLTDFQNVLDSQRFLTQQQDRLAESRGRVVKNLVRIYRALGGGWAVESDLE